MRRTLLVALLVSTLPLPGAAADPGGGDAPDYDFEALTLAAGNYSGTIESTHDADWYRIENPPGAFVRVTLTMTAPAAGTLRVFVEGESYWDAQVAGLSAFGEGTKSVTLEDQALGGAILAGVSAYDVEDYWIHLEVVPAPDFAPTIVAVEDVPLETDAARLPASVLRRVEFEVANRGLTASTGEAILSVRTPTDGTTTVIERAAVALAAHGAQRFVVEWNVLSTGTLGDVDVLVATQAHFEGTPANDVATYRHHGIVGGTGTGATAGASSGTCHHVSLFACLDAYVRPGELWVHEGAWTYPAQQRTGVGYRDGHARAELAAGAIGTSLIEAARGHDGSYLRICSPTGGCHQSALP